MCPNSSLHLVYSHILQIFIVLKYPIRKEGQRGKERERERRDGGRKERMEERKEKREKEERNALFILI